MARVFAIIGEKRVGKDVVAQYLSENHNFNHVKVAHVLKETIKVMFDLSDQQVESDIKDTIDPRYGVSPRRIMQFVGTEFGQYQLQELLPDIGRCFWIKQLCISMQKKENDKFVISDVRFQHEITELKKNFPHVVSIKITRNTGLIDTHVSEQEHNLIQPDYTIVNNSSIQTLYHKIDDIVKIHS